MISPMIILIGWIVQLIACFYFVRFITNAITRCILTIVHCIILTYMVSYDLPALHMPSMLLVTFCWLAMIRLMHLIVLSPNRCSTFRSFQSFPAHRININNGRYLMISYLQEVIVMFYIFVLSYSFLSDIQSGIVRIVTRDKYMLKSIHHFDYPHHYHGLLTQFFLLATASLQMGSFTRVGPEFYAINTPLLFDQKWIPKLPTPN